MPLEGTAVGTHRRGSPVVGNGLMREVTLEQSLKGRAKVYAGLANAG